ncbi:hypothetical protein ABZW03_26190 [Kitasatospora sp. NPDC004799]|uniref:hypothetical protein n=1 Tax=Kitasatospora sp. NPDC004799 TaxID=3154460 RepID=UPI0033AC8EC9
MYAEHDLDEHDEFDASSLGDWSPGECDNCAGGEPVETPIGLLGCACLMGQGAAPADCVCGPGRD